MDKKIISLIVPAYNEEEVIEIFYQRTKGVFNELPAYDFEVLFINDGSKDNTLEVLKNLFIEDRRYGYISLARNYGKEIAMAAGFDHVTGDAVIIIDVDLQDPPELIIDMIAKWEEGYEDVYAQRLSRDGETWLKKWTSKMFYRILARMTKVEIQKDTGDFRLLSRNALDALKQYRESERYTKGLFSLIGFKKIAIPYHRDPRAAGTTKWNYFKLVNLAIEGVTSFTTAPLKIASFIGVILALFSFVFMLIIIFKTLVYGDPVQGYPSMISIVLFLGGIQLLSLGIIGEYIGRTFLETKNRPLYFIGEMSLNNNIEAIKKEPNYIKEITK